MHSTNESQPIMRRGGSQAPSRSHNPYRTPTPSDGPFDGTNNGFSSPMQPPINQFPQQPTFSPHIARRGGGGGAQESPLGPQGGISRPNENFGLPYNPSYFNNNNQWNDVSAMGLQGLPTSMSFQDTATQRILEAIGEVKENQSTIFQQLEENQTRLTTLEAEKTTAVEQPPVPRGQSFASRGRMSQANRTALRRGRDIEQPVVEVESETEGLEDLGKLPGVLSEGAQIARALLQRYVSTKYRKLCGVKVGTEWPETDEDRLDEVTGEPYYTPLFTENVDHENNVAINKKVARAVYEELEINSERPASLKDGVYHWDETTLCKLAAGTWRGFKTVYKAQVDGAAAARKAKNQRTNRRRERRQGKKKRREQVVRAYIEKTGNDPSALLHEAHMSDEGSGPEDEEEEKIDWKRRMAEHEGITISDAQLRGLHIREVIQPAWRSEALTNVFWELDEIWMEEAPPKERNRARATLIRGTGRVNDVPPVFAPFDFGIDRAWYEAARPKYPRLLRDYFTYGNPAGFGGDNATNEEETEETTH